MGSLDTKRPPLLRSSSTSRPFFHKPRSKIARFLLFEKVDYLQWLCTAAAFFFVVVLFQAYLPSSVVERSTTSLHSAGKLGLLDELGELDFGEGLRFVPSRLLGKFNREEREANSTASVGGRTLKRAGVVRPRIALVFADLLADAAQLEMVSVAASLKEIGYDFEIIALEDGDARSIWISAGFPVHVLDYAKERRISVDWLKYNGIVVNSLEAKPVLSCLSQEPFKYVPVIWSVSEKVLASRLEYYKATNKSQIIADWKQSFARATVVTFPNYLLPILYSVLDAGNYYVIPSNLAATWRALNYVASLEEHDLRQEMGYKSDDLVIALVGSQFSYSGLLLEHTIILQAMLPIFQTSTSASNLKIAILNGNATGPYAMALEVISAKFDFPSGSITHIDFDDDSSFLGIVDIVIYGSFFEEQSFPSILIQAMSLGKLVIAPDLGILKKYVTNEVNGYLFPKENTNVLTHILSQTISDGKVSHVAKSIAIAGKALAKNFLVSESIEGYAFLFKHILKLPSEYAIPKTVDEISLKLKSEWRWDLFKTIAYTNKTKQHIVVESLEQTNPTQDGSGKGIFSKVDEHFSSVNWAEEKMIEVLAARKRLLEEEIKDRGDQFHGTWEDVYRNVKKAERIRSDLHDRNEKDLERAGQPLCIYEPYFGEGTWPFLHQSSLYRGICLGTKGRRRGLDDIDAPSRLPILSNAYYRDALGECGAFFALANLIDRIHKNAWIGFQSWRVVPMKVSLTKKAESMLLQAIESQKHGDALYFWVRMDNDTRNPTRTHFWPFCDAINAGNCRFVFSEALRRMYGLPQGWDSLPPMPANGDSWSVMHSWALPTKSFLEFVMFARMFVDALDAYIYDEHHQTGHCYLSFTKDRHCYSRVLELLVNVWAYHSARRMVYIDPETGAMQEQHAFKSRKGKMWIKWFSPAMLKTMDEDRAEEWDSDHPKRRWLWPSTGEVFWHGMFERERNMRQHEKERKRQQSKDKIKRIRNRARQKPLGKYIKLPSGDDNNPGHLNATSNGL